MNLGPFYMDIKNVPKSFDKARVLKCLQVFEECEGVQVVASEALELMLELGRETTKAKAFIKRIHVIHSHGYECLPNTKVFRVVWSSRAEPQALSVVSVIELDGVSMPLCRFGRDVCSNCFSPNHRTSGCGRTNQNENSNQIRRRNQKSNIQKPPSSSSSRRIKSNQNHEGEGIWEYHEEVNSVLSEEEKRIIVPMSSMIEPPLFSHHPKLVGQIMKDVLNGHHNCDSVVKNIPDDSLTAEHRGRMTSRGVHALPALTALELSNNLTDTRLGSERFSDLMNHSALASTELNRKWLHKTSTHLEPMRKDLGQQYYKYASSLLGKQYNDFG